MLSNQESSLMFLQTIASSLLSTVQISNHVFKQKRDCKTNREMEKCKNKSHSGGSRHIHAYSGIFMHIQAYIDIIRHIQRYSGIIQAYPGSCITLAYSELWYIKNLGIFKTRGKFRNLIYSKLWHILNERYIQNRRHTQNLFKYVLWSALRNS